MNYKKFPLYLGATLLAAGLGSCSDDDEPRSPGADIGESTTLDITPMYKLNQGTHAINSHAEDYASSSIKLDYRTMATYGPEVTTVDKIFYPRIKRMANGEYIMFFQNAQVSSTTFYAIGKDLNTWEPAKKFLSAYSITNALGAKDTKGFCTTDAVVLANGDIVTATSHRATKGYGQTPTDNGITVVRSTDNGRTWSEPIMVYQGTNYEPYLLQRKSGRIEIYFSQSRPQISSNHSGTAMVWSDDNGLTWSPSYGSEPYTVIRTQRGELNGNPLWTDQMPSVAELNVSGRLAAATEAYLDETYNISMAYSDESGEFPRIEGNGTGPSERNIKMWAGAAPYLKQFPSGETLLTYNAAQSRFYGCVGDANAKNFGTSEVLFPGVSGYWGATDIDSDHSFAGIYRNGGNIILGRFFLNHAIDASARSVTVDGDNSEWTAQDDAIFTGSKGQAQATLRCATDGKRLYFLVEVLDDDISKDDYINILLSPMTATGKINSEARRIKIASYGLKSTDQYAGGWHEIGMDVKVATAHDGTVGDPSDADHGYIAEASVALSDLPVKDGRLLVNLVLFDAASGEDAVSPTTDRSLAKWIPIRGL